MKDKFITVKQRSIQLTRNIVIQSRRFVSSAFSTSPVSDQSDAEKPNLNDQQIINKRLDNKKINLLLLYDIDGWAYHHQARALAQHAPEDFNVTLLPFGNTYTDPNFNPSRRIADILGMLEWDIIFVLDTGNGPDIKQAITDHHWNTQVIVSWNSGWPRRQERYHAIFSSVDAMVVNNLDMWNRMGRLNGTYPISNGVDLELFYPRNPARERVHKILWIGSEYHRSIKGYDDFIVPLQRLLEGEGLACDFRLIDSYDAHRWTLEEMAQWYNQGTIYLCASDSEGTPNPALEAAACGCVIVSTRVGNMLELIRDDDNGYLVDRSVSALHLGIKKPSEITSDCLVN